MQKTLRCIRCHGAFEVVGPRGADSMLLAQPVIPYATVSIDCPYDDCDETTEILWPLGCPFSVRKIPSDI